MHSYPSHRGEYSSRTSGWNVNALRSESASTCQATKVMLRHVYGSGCCPRGSPNEPDLRNRTLSHRRALPGRCCGPPLLQDCPEPRFGFGRGLPVARAMERPYRASTHLVLELESIERDHREYQYPRATWNDDSIVGYFENRFGGSPLSSVADGIYNRLPGGERAARSTRYWVGIRARAAELLEMKPHEVRPGFDYALTEIVRCKSRGEEGEPEALSTCADRYLEPTLEASAATVIVVVGAHAAKAIRWRYQLEPGKVHYGPLHIEQRDRMLTLIPHPTGRAPRKKLAGCLSPEELHSLKRWLLS